MATFVQYWRVGATVPSLSRLTVSEISSHLLVDWVPSLPVSVAPSFIGWPPYLLEASTINGSNLLLLRRTAATTERQWKSFLSWMLGVVGTRHVLDTEGYRWIAPVSAFYRNAVQTVDLSAWNPSFPKSALTASRPRGSRTKLFPDYVALRRRNRRFNWAVAEAKGTTSSLTDKRACPANWSRQARNIELTAYGTTLTVHRHLVVATRVNPNGRNPPTRRLQVRAWNREADGAEDVSRAAVELVAAHLFGLLMGLGLRQNARAIAFQVQVRAAKVERSPQFWTEDDAVHLAETADDEIQRYLKTEGVTHSGYGIELPLENAAGPIRATLAPALLRLVKVLGRTDDWEEAASALAHTDAELDDWQVRLFKDPNRKPTEIVMRCGVELSFPPEFAREANLRV